MSEAAWRKQVLSLSCSKARCSAKIVIEEEDKAGEEPGYMLELKGTEKGSPAVDLRLLRL